MIAECRNDWPLLPIDTISDLTDHLASVKSIQGDWDGVSILSDERGCNHLVCLLNQDAVCAAFHVNPAPGDAQRFFDLIYANPSSRWMSLVTKIPPTNEMCFVSDIQKVFGHAKHTQMPDDYIERLYASIEDGNTREGRGKEMTVDTKRRVLLLSHGRCMFEGCATSLLTDELTGEDAYFGYLAHIVASSEKGPRGLPGLSGQLSDDPDNVMFLCDKHHRLIDKVAESDYSRERLEAMRREHITVAEKCLSIMAYTPARAFYVGFRINHQRNDFPSPVEVSQCLSVCHWRASGDIQRVVCDDLDCDDKSEEYWKIIAPRSINKAALMIEQSSSGADPIALFATGTMPLLIALGTKLGNKSKFLPMLRSRISDRWEWPDNPDVRLDFELTEHDSSISASTSVILGIFLTDVPFGDMSILDDLANSHRARLLTISVAHPSNSVIGTPNAGRQLQDYLNALFHNLAKGKVQHIHLVTCASNAACVYIGRSIEQYHPRFTLYDFIKESESGNKNIRPRLDIIPGDAGIDIRGFSQG